MAYGYFYWKLPSLLKEYIPCGLGFIQIYNPLRGEGKLKLSSEQLNFYNWALPNLKWEIHSSWVELRKFKFKHTSYIFSWFFYIFQIRVIITETHFFIKQSIYLHWSFFLYILSRYFYRFIYSLIKSIISNF